MTKRVNKYISTLTNRFIALIRNLYYSATWSILYLFDSIIFVDVGCLFTIELILLLKSDYLYYKNIIFIIIIIYNLNMLIDDMEFKYMSLKVR